MKKLFAFLAAVAAPVLFGVPAFAAGSTIPVPLTITATVDGSCGVSTSPVAFGLYDGTLNDADGSVTVNCDLGLPYSIHIDGGAGGGVSRQMSKVGDVAVKLPYELYQVAAGDTVWGGDAYAGGGAKTGSIGSGGGDVHTVFGRIAAGTAPTPGDFTDTVSVTVNY